MDLIDQTYNKKPLHLFYMEPESDRWLPGDRFPRKIIRRIIRGKPQPGGVMRWFLNLKAGLDELGVEYLVNDIKSLRENPGLPALVIGKDHVLEKIPAKNPIIFGPGVASHPLGKSYWGKKDIRLLIISCPWFAAMYERDLPLKIPIRVWAAGIETNKWKPPYEKKETKQVLIYDKIRWKRERHENEIISPIIQSIRNKGYIPIVLKYGSYNEEDYRKELSKVDFMIFLCEHETQGFAYLQALSCNVPILAYDRGGAWQDPEYFPDLVKYSPVTSVPYWDDSVGVKFKSMDEYNIKLDEILNLMKNKKLFPRTFIEKKLTLKTGSQNYLNIIKESNLWH